MTKTSKKITERPWLVALLIMPIGAPLALWASWDTISAMTSIWLQILVGLGFVILAYLGLTFLLWWNRFTQSKWRKYGVIK